MSKHFRDCRGRLLQANKTWKNLRPKQQEYLRDQLREGYLAAWKATGKEPSPEACRKILDSLDCRGIWIPEPEIEAYLAKKKKDWRKQHLKGQQQSNQAEHAQGEEPS